MSQWSISQRWLDAQRLGVTASVMITHPGIHPAFRVARKILQKDIAGSQVKSNGFEFFRSLPHWVLAGLARALKQRSVPDLNRFAVLAERALHHNMIGRQDDTSTIARAQILAYHVLLAHTRADGLLRLGRTIFGHYKEWVRIDASPVSVAKISSCLAAIRDPLLSTQEKCLAIHKLGEILGCTPFWEQVENILYHNQFCWPLLVFDSGRTMRRYTQTLALSLPVAIDVCFDNCSEISEKAETGVINPRWEKTLRRAVCAAKTLWGAEHENCGTFRDLVEKASVIFDFSPAERIVEHLAKGLNAKIALFDRSAEAYFAEVVLGRLLGRGNVMVCAITGAIGDQMRDETGVDQPNFLFEAPQEMLAKIEYTAATGVFERIVLPETRASREAAETFLREFAASHRGKAGTSPTLSQPIELLYAEDLQSVSDHVHPFGWRGHRYIRCPEVEWGIHSEGGPGLKSPSEDKGVEKVIGTLASKDSAMLTLEVSPMVVASAFWQINNCLRLRKSVSSKPLSWAFINVAGKTSGVLWDDEKDIFFWELFFEAIGSGPDEFLKFLRHPSRQEAVNHVANLLNKFVPAPERPGLRCPDLLVIIGGQTLLKSAGRSRTPSGRPFMVTPILNELKDSLRPVGRPGDPVSGLIGEARIIILPKAESDEVPEENIGLGELNEDGLQQLRYLATLEDSFTTRTAGLLLSHLGDPVQRMPLNDILEKFVRVGVLRQVHGKYHVPSFVAAKIPPDRRPEDKVKRYYAAGAALAPYVTGGQGPLSMAVDIAFTPEHFEEARQQFIQALHYSRKTGCAEVGRFRKLCEESVRRLARFVVAPSWANVSRLLKGANRLPGLSALEPYEKACELLGWYEEAQIPPHPFHLVTTADSAVRAASCIHLYVENPDVPEAFRIACPESPLQLHVKAKELYLQALRRCAALPKNEQDRTLLFCLTKYLVYLCHRHWILIEHETQLDRENKEAEIQHCWSQIQDLLNRRVKLLIVEGLECFELMGDREPDHGKALDIYLKGIETGLIWSPLSLKTWGTASLCGQTDRLNRMLESFPAQEGHLIYKAFYNSSSREAKLSPHEIPRIREGLRVFEDRYGNDQRVRASRAAFDRDYGRVPIRRWAENVGLFFRGVVTELKSDQHYGFIRSDTGGQYRFQGFQLVEGSAYEDIRVGMELDFQILRKSTEGRFGDAVNVRKPIRPSESPVQKGKISALKPDGRYGFITSGGKDYHFHASRLAGGLAFCDIWEGMEVEFQIGEEQPEGKADEATNIRQVSDLKPINTANGLDDIGVRGVISELKQQGRYGFIASEGQEYHFHASHLSNGLEYEDLQEGMEVEFHIVREFMGTRGQASRIRTISDRDKSDSSYASPPERDDGGERILAPAAPQEVSTPMTQRGKVSLFKRDGRYGFISARGTDYYFNGWELRGDLTCKNVYEGMEVEFKIKKERTDRLAGEATDVLLIDGIEVWKASTQAHFMRGTVSFVKPENNYGFIRSSDGLDYHFSASDLREGLIFKNVHEGMEVEFQVRKKAGGNQAPEAMNVRHARIGVSADVQALHQPQSSTPARGTVYFIKKEEAFGFIRSPNGQEYQFHASDLTDEIEFNDVHNDMEVEFQIWREGEAGRAGKAIQISPANVATRDPLPFQRGVVYCLVPDKKCGFITSRDGKEYQFTLSDLVGTSYEAVLEGAEVTFQIRREPGKIAGKAFNVRLHED